MKKLLVIAVIGMLISATASAQTPGDRIRRERIEQGFRSGQLTRPERSRLHHDQMRYKNERRRAFRDGVVTPREKRKLHHMRVHDRHEMYRMKHNPRRRVI